MPKVIAWVAFGLAPPLTWDTVVHLFSVILEVEKRTVDMNN
jgi:hypothetical protein